jgi:hypothetical protein
VFESSSRSCDQARVTLVIPDNRYGKSTHTYRLSATYRAPLTVIILGRLETALADGHVPNYRVRLPFLLWRGLLHISWHVFAHLDGCLTPRQTGRLTVGRKIPEYFHLWLNQMRFVITGGKDAESCSRDR